MQIVIVHEDRFDAVVDEVEGADEEVEGEVELLSVGRRVFSLACVE